MTFPVNEQEFCERWLSVLSEADEGDREQAMAIVQGINRAYYARPGGWQEESYWGATGEVKL